MKTKIIVGLMLVLFLAGFVSSLEFDNVKSYDSSTRTAIITNAFGLGGEIAKVKLLSDLDVKVGAGYQKVAEFEIDSYSDYAQAIKSIELYNLRDKSKTITRKIDFKYKVYEDVEEMDYERVCIEDNITNLCSLKKVGSHINKNQEVWKDLSSMDIKIEKITIGLFTDAQVGDSIEWIPTLFGVRVSEWATWTTSLDVGLLAYYKLDDIVGDVVDSGPYGFNGANQGVTRGEAGLLNSAFKTTSLIQSINLTNLNTELNADFSISMWYKNTTGNNDLFYVHSDGGSYTMCRLQGDGKVKCYIRGGTNNSNNLKGIVGQWTHLVLTRNDSISVVYINGTADNATVLLPNTIDVNSSEKLYLGNYLDGNSYIGIYDEIGVWNRSLTSAEVTQLYNSGAGLAYGSVLAISSNLPINMTNSTSQINVFSLDVSEYPPNIVNVSLYLNGTINGTNTSGIVGNYNFSRTLADGAYLWLGGVCNSTGSCVNSTARQLNIDSVLPTIFISYGNGTLPYRNATAFGGNQTVNYTITDTNLGSCWITYNTTNRTTPCTSGEINVTNLTLQWGEQDKAWNATLWVNDTFGQTVSQFFNWTYTIFENNVTYTNPAPGGGIVNMAINLTYPDSFTGITVKAHFNGTNYTMSTADVGYIQKYSASATAPLVGTPTNKNIYFIILLTNATGTFYYNSSNFTIVINPFLIDNCVAYNETLFNFSMVDEETLAEMDGTILMNINLYAYGTTFLVGKYNQTFTYYSGVHNASICALNNSLTYTNYTAAYIIQHFGDTDYYFKKYRIVQNMTINNETAAQNITLYNLKFAQSSSRTVSHIMLVVTAR
jgi:hypothetical protein